MIRRVSRLGSSATLDQVVIGLVMLVIVADLALLGINGVSILIAIACWSVVAIVLMELSLGPSKVGTSTLRH